MPKDTRQMMIFLAEGYEKIASSLEKAVKGDSSNVPDNKSDFDRGYIAGYAQGQITAYKDMAADLRKALRDSPS